MNTANVIHFQRVQNVTGWPLYQIRQWCRENGWKHGFRFNAEAYLRTGKVIIERLRK